MKTYQVEIVEKIVFQVSVEAADKTEAEKMARDQYDKGILEGNGEKEEYRLMLAVIKLIIRCWALQVSCIICPLLQEK